MEDYHTVIQLIAGIVAFIAYIPLAIGIFRDTAKQSFAAFLLWAMLDTIAMATTWIQEGNHWLALGNVIGSTAITVLLIVKKQVSWSRIETITAFLVIVCLTIWYSMGETAGIIASSLAVVIASFPQMVDTFRNPSGTPQIAYLIFLCGNILSLFAGREWTIEERFYAACSTFICAVILLLSTSKTKVAT